MRPFFCCGRAIRATSVANSYPSRKENQKNTSFCRFDLRNTRAIANRRSKSHTDLINYNFQYFNIAQGFNLGYAMKLTLRFCKTFPNVETLGYVDNRRTRLETKKGFQISESLFLQEEILV